MDDEDERYPYSTRTVTGEKAEGPGGTSDAVARILQSGLELLVARYR